MSIHPVSPSVLPYYGPLAPANSSPIARPVASAHETPDTTALEPAATSSGTDRVGYVESTLERALRQARIATGTSTSGESTSGSGRYAPAIGLYRRVSQYGDEGASVSGLMKSWNDIVRDNRFEAAGVAGYVKAVAQNDAVTLPSRVLHLTA